MTKPPVYKVLSHKRVLDVLEYDENTGIFRWRVKMSRVAQPGSIAGWCVSGGYRQIGIDGVLYKASRLAWFYCFGYWPENCVDHINQICDDDRIRNLREASRQCNIINSKKYSTNKSGVREICWLKKDKRWKAYIITNYRTNILGYYKDFSNAVCARLAAEQCLGWSRCDSESSASKYVNAMLGEA